MNWVKVRREFHQIPELGFKEVKTQEKILNFIEEIKTEYIRIEKWRTGVLVFVEGKGDKNKTIGFRCDIDGLPIQEQNNVEYRSLHEGRMHACGHDFHITFGLMLIKKLAKEKPMNNYLVIFQPAEEGPGGAELLISEKKELFEELDHIFAFHIDPTLETGVIGYNEKELFAGTQEINIQMKSQGGHAAYPEKATDLTKIFAEMYLASCSRKRPIDGTERVIVHLGRASIGEARNSFPTEVTVNGTIRSYDKRRFEDEIHFLKQQLEISGIKFEIKRGPYYEPVVNDSQKTEEMIEKIKRVIKTKRVEPQYTGEDFGFYGLVCPAVMCWIGAKSKTGLHTDTLEPDEAVFTYFTTILDSYIE